MGLTIDSQIVSTWLLFSLTVCLCRSIQVTGFVGQNLTLHCRYNFKYHGKCEICWMRGEIPNFGCGNEIIASDGDKAVRQTSHRYHLDGELQKGDASLTIYNTRLQDSGRYGCRVHVPGLFNDEKNIVELVILNGSSPTTKVNTLSSKTFATAEPPYNKPTYVISTSTSYNSNDTTPEIDRTEKELTEDTLPVTLVSILLILLVFGVAVFLIWKKKTSRGRRTRRESLDMDQNVSAIYNNSEVSLGLYNRSMAVENIYQLDTENEYEQWSR